MTKHSLGPWWTINRNGAPCIYNGFEYIAQVLFTIDDSVAQNARLIAAAPDMLAAIKQVASRLEYGEPFAPGEVDLLYLRLKIAMDKANGEAK
jgi:hypothetical protein